VIDLDIRSFFSSVDHDLLLRAVRRHTDLRWVLLYVERWLKAPLQRRGVSEARDRGTPEGSAISPLLANLFLHYAFDAWMAREFPGVPFERYCDDAVVHCATERQARVVLDAIAERLARCRLELHPVKTRIVYCKDSNRRGSHEHEQFGFLGYTFRPRLARSRSDALFVSFSPAVSNDAAKAVRRAIKRWRLHRRSQSTLEDLARAINAIVQGWANYYGRFYPTVFARSLILINEYLVRWAMWKYKRLRRHPTRARAFLASVARREPDLFAHWRLGVRP
jgi:RNA-directed DNA polymerase